MDPSRHDLYWMLYPPQSITQAIVHLQRQLNASYGGPSKPMAPDRLHATLLPLGVYPHRIPLDILQMARRAGALLDAEPFPVCFDTLQSLGPQCDVGTVELAGHGTGVRPLVVLRQQLVAALLTVGWPAERIRPGFTPHISVDYRHTPVNARRIEPLVWEVTEFLLVDSHYGKGHHEVLGRWSLGCRQPSLFD